MFHKTIFRSFVVLMLSITFELTKEQQLIPLPPLKISGSELIDKVLTEVKKMVVAHNLDPMLIPNASFPIDNETLSLFNGEIRGLSNIHRVGPVEFTLSLEAVKFKCACSVNDIQSNQGVELKTSSLNYANGNIRMNIDNVTAYQVFKLDFVTQTPSLEEFELSVGDVKVNITGLGDVAEKGSNIFNKIVEKTKDPILMAFSVTIQMLVNSALEALKAALIVAMG